MSRIHSQVAAAFGFLAWAITQVHVYRRDPALWAHLWADRCAGCGMKHERCTGSRAGCQLRVGREYDGDRKCLWCGDRGAGLYQTVAGKFITRCGACSRAGRWTGATEVEARP